MSSTSKLSSANNDTPKFVARYIDNFIDLVENVPNDLSRRITRVHELQLDYESSLAKLETNLTKFSRPQMNPDGTINDLKQLKLLLATQHHLSKMQEMSDSKLAIIQEALDQLDYKSRELDHDYKLINAATSDSNEHGTGAGGGASGSGGAGTTSGASGSGNNKNSKSGGSSGRNQTGAGSSAHVNKNSSSSSHRESPEPTYCVCRQVSYGDMICCDNDACDIEWFHFQCVSLTSKPKGKWYCPNCRGDRSNQLKK